MRSDVLCLHKVRLWVQTASLSLHRLLGFKLRLSRRLVAPDHESAHKDVAPKEKVSGTNNTTHRTNVE